MRVVDLIQTKRDGGQLSREEIEFFQKGLVDGSIPEAQAAALLMAVFFQGLKDEELADWVECGAAMSTPLDLGNVSGPKVSKHSTGGVGDKTSLVVAPLVAAAGVTVPMIAGRGMGYSGGSLDKVEAIPGFNARLNGSGLKSVLEKAGAAYVSRNAQEAPADRKLEVLRNSTGTVECVPLIAASLLSRKLAEKTDALLVDVKTGSGGLMKKMTDSRRLAQALVTVGKRLNQRVLAVITDMDQPLGNAVGNALEVMEAVETMRGGGPEDLVELSLELGARVLCLAYPDRTLESCKDQCFKLLNDGAALQKFRQILEAQGGNPQVIDSFELLPTAGADFVISSPRAGFISRISADDIGQAVSLLGAPESEDGPSDPAVGIVLEHKVGDRIQAGERLCTIYYNSDKHLEEASQMVEDAYHIAAAAPEARPLVYEVIQ